MLYSFLHRITQKANQLIRFVYLSTAFFTFYWVSVIKLLSKMIKASKIKMKKILVKKSYNRLTMFYVINFFTS